MNAILLGALLHDLGKVGRRAGLSGDHQEIGSSALQLVLPQGLKEIANLALTHHDSSKLAIPGFEPLKRIILANWISAGQQLEGKETMDVTAPLQSIFNNIDIKKGGVPKSAFYTPASLKISRDIVFPKDTVTEDVYKKTWDAINSDFLTVQKIQDTDDYFTTVLYLLKKHTWSIPSGSNGNSSDISLYDHSRIVCAIARCLNDEELDEALGEFNSGVQGKERFLLVAGDVSGIQDFLYTITSKGALKGLRGRSLYLQLLSEAVAKFILRELDYPLTNLIYSGGGHFYLLIGASDEEKIEVLQTVVERALLRMHHGDLFLALGWSKLTVKDLCDITPDNQSSLPLKWSEALGAAGEAKLRRFSSLGYDEYKEIFGPNPMESGGVTPVCDVCKREGELRIRTDKGWEERDKQGDEAAFCDLCRTFETMGERLPRAEYLIEVNGAKSSDDSNLLCSFEPLRIHYYSCKRKELPDLMKSFRGSKSVIYSLEPGKFIDDGLVSVASKSNAALGFRLIAKATPMINERIIMGMSELANSSRGVPRIGVLRMDVDDLGKIFSEGLGKNATLARISTLSSMLSIFFDGWIDKICEEWKKNVYLIYSGGDDLFLVGSWDVIPEIAIRIRDDFRVYTCSNPNFTLSGGIILADEKYPLYKSAELAKKALDDAKDKKTEDKQQKDAVTFLNETLNWTEMGISKTIADHLASWIESGIDDVKLPRSILWNLYSAWDLYWKNRDLLNKKSLSQQDIVRLALYDRWRWRLIYFLDRAGGRTKVFESRLFGLKTCILDGKWNNITSPRDLIEYLGVPTRWAELLTRAHQGGKS